MGRNRKEYAITQAGCDVVDINEYRKAPWVQTWGIHTHDFRRWLYIGRPNLNKHKHGKGLVHAGRDNIVSALRDAVWNAVVRDTTKQFYCANGLAIFFEFLDARHKIHPVTSLEQIDRVLLEEFIYWLRHIKQANTETGRLAYNGARKGYSAFKSVLLHLVQQNALLRDFFPVNPFPNSNRTINNHAPYSKQVMRELLKALSQDIQELRSGKLKLSPSESLTVYLLVIAARSGRNPTPLLEATRDALQPHPIKPQQMALLQLYKNRGSTSHLQGYRFQRKFEDVVSVPMDVITLFHEVDGMTAPLVNDAPVRLKNRLWIYRSLSNRNYGELMALSLPRYRKSTLNIVKRHNLKEIDGEPLKLNISRLRATFTQRMWYLTSGDIVKTAKLAGNHPNVTDRHYLTATPEMEANHRRLGHVMHADLSGALDNPDKLESLSREVGIPADQLLRIANGENSTGVGRCRDPLHGAKAPGDGALCTRWLACFTCPDQVVLESDIYRLYSFYFLLIKERNFMQRQRWDEVYGPIINIIDNEIVDPNLRTAQNPRGCFYPLRVKRMRERAEREPHPMWRSREILALGTTDE